MAAAHFQLGVFLRHALASGQLIVCLPVFAVTLVEVRVDDVVVHALLQAQAEFLHARVQHGRAAHQDRARQFFIDHHLHRAQDALFFAFGVDDALHFRRGLLGHREHRLHEGAGTVDELLQAVGVGFQVLDRTGGDAGIGSGFRHGRCNLGQQARVERHRDQVFRTEGQVGDAVGGGDDVRLFGVGQVGDRVHHGDFHFAGDGAGAAIERAAEDIREAQHVVDLVRVVRTAGADDGVAAHRFHVFRQDFRIRVGQGQDQRVRRHLLDHVLFQHAAGGQAEEDVGALDAFGQGAVRGLACEALLVRVHQLGAALVDHAGQVGDQDVLDREAEVDDQVQAGQGRGAGAGNHQLDVLDVLADVFQAVQDGRADDDGGTVLVVVEDRDLHLFAQLALDVEALRRLDVFQVDAAEGRFQRGDDVDQLVRVLLVDLDVEDVDAGELLEQHALAFHHRLGSQRTDIAQAQHGSTVGDDGHQVAARRVFIGVGRVDHDFFAWRGHARGVGQRKVALVGQLLGRGDADFAWPWALMVFQCRGAQLLAKFFFLVRSRIHAVLPLLSCVRKPSILADRGLALT